MIGFHYEIQLRRKSDALGSALKGYREIDAAQLDSVRPASTTEGYRTRLKWIAGPKGALGLFAEGTHNVVDTPHCLVAHPILRRVGDAIRALLRDDAHAHMTHDVSAVDLRQIQYREGKALVTGAVVTWILQASHTIQDEELREFSRRLVELAKEVLSVHWSVRVSGSPQILGRGGGVLFGPTELMDETGSVETFVTAGSFVQAHRGQAAAIESAIVARSRALAKNLKRQLRVLELYAGSGAFGLALAKAGAAVVSVESYPPAARSIEAAAAVLGVEITSRIADAEAYVRELTTDPSPFDFVVVDPPRRGLPPALRAGLAKLRHVELVYVSCDPRTLARDLADLARLGLVARRVTPIDMFPQTAHVEAIAWLARDTPIQPRLLFEDDDVVAFDKPGHESTAELGQRIEATTARTGLVPLTSLPTFASGPVLFAKRANEASELRQEISATSRVRSTALLKGISSSKGSIARSVPGHTGISKTRYKRNRILSSHSLVKVEGGADVEVAMIHMAMLGHAVIGDPKRSDEPTRRHFFEKHGLDRAYWALTSISFARGGRLIEVISNEPPDLASVRTSLMGDRVSS